jgi:class 3 adenylate cyclase
MSSSGSGDAGTRRSREHLFAQLSRIIAEPERRDEIAREIEADFTERRAVLVLDMSGFSRTTQVHGVVAFLVMIHQMRLLAGPVIAATNGVLLKAEADNLYCLFDTVDDAVAASRQIMGKLAAANVDLPHHLRLYASIGIGFGDILVLTGKDMFGDEVNLASKLGEDVAQVGDVLLTEAARAALDPAVVTAEARASISGLTLVYHAVR